MFSIFGNVGLRRFLFSEMSDSDVVYFRKCRTPTFSIFGNIGLRRFLFLETSESDVFYFRKRRTLTFSDVLIIM